MLYILLLPLPLLLLLCRLAACCCHIAVFAGSKGQLRHQLPL
jgi:hypothetical protein